MKYTTYDVHQTLYTSNFQILLKENIQGTLEPGEYSESTSGRVLFPFQLKGEYLSLPFMKTIKLPFSKNDHLSD